ncbi:hypothetical protein L1987_18939 [Smallanthus sonchifolius]|uniref:Uncharacterized protein n=1 Tax=Smallanthus sonchifolius TaxID=185202 RepID=A0ACB9J251_9ASTR|nr:hypothetical protein L1987_18939 [Smallanthus sonchifolius]
MQDELSQFQKLHVWDLVDLPKGFQPIGTRWVFKCKTNDRHVVVKNKARLVVQGFYQQEGLDYTEVYAPVARIEAIRLFLAYATYVGFKIRSDVVGLCLGQPRLAHQASLNVWTQADYGTNARMSVWVANANANKVRNLKTMAGGGRTGRRGGRTGRVNRPPLNQRHQEEEDVHTKSTESVHQTNVTPIGGDHQGSLQLEPEVRDVIAREVVLTLKNVLPDLLTEALKKIKEDDEGNNEEKVYDSDGDEIKVGSSNRGCTYKGFKDGDPPKFDGNKDSVATFEWIERMNAVINISECRPDQAVKYVAHSFTNEALGWWRNIQRIKSPNAIARMTWEDLKKLIIQKFCPQNEIDRVENEFLNFKVGNKTHRQYTSRFNELAQLEPHLVETEDRLIEYYVKGLPQRVRVHVKTNLPSTFESVVNLSGIVYDDYANEDPAPETQKRKWENPSRGTGKRDAAAEVKRPRSDEYETCKKCGKHHLGECRIGTIMCYKCGKPGHFSRECLKDVKFQSCGRYGHLTRDWRKTRQSGSRKEKEAEKEQPRARTRAYALTEEEARGNPDVVSGTFLVNDEHAAILFDSGASKSFISNAFSQKLDCTVNTIVKAFNVQTAVGKNLVVFQVTDDCIIEREGHKFPSRLFLLTLGGFDVVLGMDWLAANEAQIICKRKRIHLKDPSRSPIMVYGDWNCTMPNVI